MTASIRIFISHAHDEHELATAWRDLLEAVLPLGTETWLSSDADQVTLDYRLEIRKRLKWATHVLALFTPQSGRNSWMLWESGAATGITTKGKLVPVFHGMSSDDLPAPIRSITAFDGCQPGAIEKLLRTLAKQATAAANLADWSTRSAAFQSRVQTALALSKVRASEAGRAPSCGTFMRYYHVHVRVRGTVAECRSGECFVSYIGSGLVESSRSRIEYRDTITGIHDVGLRMEPGARRLPMENQESIRPDSLTYVIGGEPPLRIDGEINGKIYLTPDRKLVGLHVPCDAMTTTFVVDMSGCAVRPKQPSALLLLLESNSWQKVNVFRQLHDPFVWLLSHKGVPANSGLVLKWDEESS